MRMLGTSKKTTRFTLSLEQMFLSIAGLLVGACGLVAYKGAGLTDISRQLFLFAALYFIIILTAAAVSAIAVTRRSVLDLLQTKE